MLSLFSGIGAFESGLDRLGINYELVGFSEIDKYAITSYCAIHNVDEDKNLGDVSKVDIESIPNCDLVTYGFPCQDISVAGHQKGIIKGETRSGLLYEALRIIKAKKPKYAIAENVKNLVGKQFKDDFEGLLKELDEYGYNNYWQVLNAKDFGIPQNRERAFIISIRKDVDDGKFEFPVGFDNGLKLKDFLDKEVDEKYYINRPWHVSTELDEKHDTNEIAQLEGINYKATRSITDINKICRCLDTMGGGQREPKVVVREATKLGYAIATVGDSINIAFPKSETRRGRVGEGVAQTLETGCNQATLESDYRIRKLTPKECWRLMGFSDEDFEKARQSLIDTQYNGSDRANSQLYKQAGNSIVVEVLVSFYKSLFRNYIDKYI